MPSHNRLNSPTRSNHLLRLGNILLALLGTLDALYLWIYKISNNDKMCLGSGDCATVNYSPYSEIYGIPVALLGLLAYLAILAILFLEPSWKPAGKYGSYIIFGVALVGVLFSAYLTFIEFFVINAVCPFCIISAVVLTMLFILSIIRLVKNNN
jgi:uncharacterized membrane protein